MKITRISAPAKLNLFLDVTGRRDNGYHEIDSIMQSVSLIDELNIEIDSGSGIEVACSSPFAPSGEKNIVWRAAEKYLTENKINASLKIELTKNIPSPAGMGGGSADAAALLRELNRHFGAMDYDELVSLALTVGSDVPFCLRNGTQRVRGLGDKLEPIRDFMYDNIILIAISGEDVPTSQAYKALDEKYDNFRDYVPSRSPKPLIAAIEKHDDIKAVCAGMYNIFEDVVLPHCPKAQYAKNTMLNCGALGAMMSGSGSAVFGIFRMEDEDKADFVKHKLSVLGIGVHFSSDFYKTL